MGYLSSETIDTLLTVTRPDQYRLKKQFCLGTQRICSPEETWQRVHPLLPSFGITRVADITWLDRIGLPVYVVLRPNSRTLAQSTGKGIAPIQAKVSGVMESIESWHAEELRTADLVASIEELQQDKLLTYNPYLLSSFIRRAGNSFLCDTLPLEWLACYDLTNRVETFLPYEMISLNWCVEFRNWLPSFGSDTNGLASGNSLLEAVLHGLYELIERDAMQAYNFQHQGKNSLRFIDIKTIDSQICQQIIELCRRTNAKLYIEDMSPPDIDVTVFKATLSLNDHIGLAEGLGCHSNREIAMLRAISEAVQSRVVVISAARDDINAINYNRPSKPYTEARMEQQLAEISNLIDFHTTPNSDNEYIEKDLMLIIDALKTARSSPVIVADLTKPEFGISVVKVVVPNLQFLGTPSLGMRIGRANT